MNFENTYRRGQKGENLGLPLGLPIFEKTMGGLHRQSIYVLAAAPKVGKSTFADFSFLLSPYLYCIEHPEIEVDWIYFSFEVSRIEKEFKMASFFFYKDYNLAHYQYQGETFEICADYFMGRQKDRFGNMVPVSLEHEKILFEIQEKRLKPLFGDYSEEGLKIKNGIVDFIADSENPTGIRNYLFQYAKKNGNFIFEPYTTMINDIPVEKQRIVGYKPNNPKKYVIVITDHMRKLRKEKGYSMKENIDKLAEYQVELRNWCGFTFVDIIHLNRNIGDLDRIKFFSNKLYPTGDDIKDTGNLSEEANYLFTMFNPKMKNTILKHFDLDLENYPNYRSIHLAESRHTKCPIHTRVNLYGYINYLEHISV